MTNYYNVRQAFFGDNPEFKPPASRPPVGERTGGGVLRFLRQIPRFFRPTEGVEQIDLNQFQPAQGDGTVIQEPVYPFEGGQVEGVQYRVEGKAVVKNIYNQVERELDFQPITMAGKIQGIQKNEYQAWGVSNSLGNHFALDALGISSSEEIIGGYITRVVRIDGTSQSDDVAHGGQPTPTQPSTHSSNRIPYLIDGQWYYPDGSPIRFPEAPVPSAPVYTPVPAKVPTKSPVVSPAPVKTPVVSPTPVPAKAPTKSPVVSPEVAPAPAKAPVPFEISPSVIVPVTPEFSPISPEFIPVSPESEEDISKIAPELPESPRGVGTGAGALRGFITDALEPILEELEQIQERVDPPTDCEEMKMCINEALDERESEDQGDELDEEPIVDRFVLVTVVQRPLGQRTFNPSTNNAGEPVVLAGRIRFVREGNTIGEEQEIRRESQLFFFPEYADDYSLYAVYGAILQGSIVEYERG